MSRRHNLLDVEGLTVSYETDYGPLAAVREASLGLDAGEALGLVGESGSGKSTVANAILDLLGPGATVEQGRIEFKGEDLNGLPAARRRRLLGREIGAVFQDPFTSLNPSIRVGRQIAEPLIEHRGLSEAEARSRVHELLEEVRIPRVRDVAAAYPHQLSGGMKQRALIAIALACEPSLVILDEPTTALDVTIEAQILDLFSELRESRRLSFLFISHNLAVVHRLCDRVCVLYAGEVVEQAPAQTLFRGPRHPYTKGLLASLPHIGGRAGRQRLSPIPGGLPNLVERPPGCIFEPRCPFAEPRCKTLVPPLAQSGPASVARCIRLEAVGAQSWPAPAGETHRSRTRLDGALLRTEELTKKFRLGGFWESLRLRRRGESGPPIAFERRMLTAVDRVTLYIAPGEVLGLVGESGCGKSTLGRCLIRLIEPSGGTIIFDGAEITARHGGELKLFRRAAQIIFQNPDSSLNPRMTVREIIARPLLLFGIVPRHAVGKRVTELLDLVRLSPRFAGRYPHQLSGGEKQRVGIARALASEPKFIVCDEAVSALDVSVQAAVVNLLAELRDELDLALLFISHDLSVVAYLADRIAVMYQGAIVELGETADVLRPPYHPYTQALLSAVPQVGVDGGPARIRLRGEVSEQRIEVPHCRFHPRCPMKIGLICETATPPRIEASQGHYVVCHHELERLRAMSPVIE